MLQRADEAAKAAALGVSRQQLWRIRNYMLKREGAKARPTPAQHDKLRELDRESDRAPRPPHVGPHVYDKNRHCKKCRKLRAKK